MQGISPTPPHKPITTRAAENGMYLSIYISVLVLATGLATSFAPATFVVWAGSIGMPFFLYKLLKRSNEKSGGALGFPELWAEGIASFFLGTLLPALLAFVLLRFVAPSFLSDTICSSIETLSSYGSPEADELADMLGTIIESGKLPTASDVAAEIISFNIIIGTFLSAITALLVYIRYSAKRNKAPKQ